MKKIRSEYVYSALGILLMSFLYAYRYWLLKDPRGLFELKKAVFLGTLLSCTYSVPVFFLVRFYCKLKDGKEEKGVSSFKIVWEALAAIALALVAILGIKLLLFGW